MCLLHTAAVFADPRTFEELFPYISGPVRDAVFSEHGFSQWVKDKKDLRVQNLNNLAEIRAVHELADNNPSYIVESFIVIPQPREWTCLEMFNVLQDVESIAGRPYFSHTRGREIPLFSESVRISDLKTKREILPPPPFLSLPAVDTVLIRLKDANFGGSYYRSELAALPSGLLYTITNAADLSLLFVPVIKKERFSVRMYLEPLAEGVLIYSAAVVSVTATADSFADIPSAVQKRLAVITGWFIDGLWSAHDLY